MVLMRRTVDLDTELDTELSKIIALAKEKPGVVIRQALKAGLRVLTVQFQSTRPSGYFTSDYDPDKGRVTLESSMSKVRQRPER